MSNFQLSFRYWKCGETRCFLLDKVPQLLLSPIEASSIIVVLKTYVKLLKNPTEFLNHFF